MRILQTPALAEACASAAVAVRVGDGVGRDGNRIAPHGQLAPVQAPPPAGPR